VHKKIVRLGETGELCQELLVRATGGRLGRLVSVQKTTGEQRETTGIVRIYTIRMMVNAKAPGFTPTDRTLGLEHDIIRDGSSSSRANKRERLRAARAW
jgi:hypothetical protein